MVSCGIVRACVLWVEDSPRSLTARGGKTVPHPLGFGPVLPPTALSAHHQSVEAVLFDSVVFDRTALDSMSRICKRI